MFRITRKYLLCLMMGASMLPAASCTANGKAGQEKAGESVAASDESIFKEKMAIAVRDGYVGLPIGDRVVALGKLLLGIPYVGGTLEVDSLNESLVTNLRGLDCVTFYENALAMARTLKASNPPGFQSYRSYLAQLRYRGGYLDGFSSRLHYSSDYFFDNVQKGTMLNVTQEVGGALAKRDNRRIDFMSTHPNAYKQIKASAEQLEKIKMLEEDMHLRGGFFYIPKSSVAKIEKNIQNGDIIGITTSIKGLDMSHTGIAVRGDDGVLRFMHASSALNKVVISEGSLSEYLAANGKQTGIVVMRPLDVATK
jgi:hypothetical protein